MIRLTVSCSLRGLATLLLAFLVAACDTTTPEPQAEVVVEAYFEAGASLGDVRLSRAVAVDQPSTAEMAVEGATVVVERVGAGGTVRETVTYEEIRPGRYRPDAPAIVKPGGRYRLRVTRSGGAPLTAETTVPGSLQLVEAQNERVVYQGPAQPSFTVAPSPVEGRQNVFIFTTTSQLSFDRLPTDELVEELTPFYRDAFDADEDDEISDLRVTSSPILNASNYQVHDDGTLGIDLPWIAVAFFGPNTVAISALDDNLFDLIRTQQAQQGGLAPGEIPNVIDHVDGGTGIFGSYARAEAEVFIERPEGQ